MLLLRDYDLTGATTVADDPILWVAVLRDRFSPDPFRLQRPVLRFRVVDFAVGIRGKPGGPAMLPLEIFSGEVEWFSGIHVTERWQMRPGRNGLVTAARADRHGAGAAWITVALSRPSKGEDTAVVYYAERIGPRTGGGSAVIWHRENNGSWHSTGSRIGGWIS